MRLLFCKFSFPCALKLRLFKMSFDTRLFNVIVLSCGFMLTFTAFQTMGNIEKTILDSIKEDDKTFTADGYTSLAIIYAVFATCNWLAPSFISVTGPRTAMLTGSCCYVAFIASFLLAQTELLYVVSALVGLGAALIWTGQGMYLTQNSDPDTMSRNAGLFWAIFQCSMFMGNIFVYFMFSGSTIVASTRNMVFWVLTSLALIGTVVLATLRKAPKMMEIGEAEGVSSADKELHIPEPAKDKPLMAAWHALRDSFRLFITWKMMLLSITFFYAGLVLTFYSGVYSASIGFTQAMGSESKKLVGLSGIFIGVGEVVAGALFGILASKTVRFGRDPIVIVGFIVHMFAFCTIFLNLPDDSPFQTTAESGFISASPTLAMIGSLALGFGDACFNTQVYALLGVLYAKDSAPAFALFKFTQSVAAAISFSYSSHIGLYIQLGILVCFLVLGTLTFCIVEFALRRQKKEQRSESDPALVDVSGPDP
ncbi:UNC93-like protein MFSD11 [Neodiprion lecontei]|uniref:UNC93-like protein MFSD11 n=1 Tax=Neodiprion lecontei TaxID=441921 RepID=A0A6J0BB69_NEOLC|nr:UNC93-like protein MFSD11 [Neodiprion lecontei]